jgi:predicted metal-binding membrane protein
MHDTTLERLIRRDRIVVSIALICITVLAWLYVLRLAADMEMGGMDLSGMRMVSTGLRMVMSPSRKAWNIQEFSLMFVMWAVMMVGMMAPSVAPVVLLYVNVRRRAVMDGQPFASTGWFVGGYLLAWSGFSFLATVAQWALERNALLTPMMVMASIRLGGLLLMITGLYQWSPLKRLCLAHCTSPITFLQRHGGFRRDAPKSLALGIQHGIYCLGCCWALMVLLFVGGVMNVTWIAGISVLVLVEKATSAGRAIGRIAGIGLVAAGGWLLIVSTH